MLYLMLSISLSMSIVSFLFLNHSLSMRLILFLQTISMCLISGFIMMFWFSYILLLIYLGGMMVLFVYVTTLASSKMFLCSITIFNNYFSTHYLFNYLLL